MRAMKVIFLSAAENFQLHGVEIRQLSIAETEDILKKRKAKAAGYDLDPNIASKLEYAARACRQGVSRAHLLNGNIDEALLAELFSHHGIGAMIYSNEYQQIRRVYKKDVRTVMALIRQSVESDELIRRTRADITAHLEDYWVIEVDRTLVGCVALHIYPDEHQAEMACLYVSKDHSGEGYGKKLMAFVEQLAAQKGVKEIFALSTQAFAYFQQKGAFQETTPDILPQDRRDKYDQSGRNSKVLIKRVRENPAGAVPRVG